jgi:uncharacterized phage-associated protein
MKKFRAIRTWVNVCFEWIARFWRARAGMHLQYRPRYDKIIEVMLHLAHLRPGLDKYQVVKLLYLADREHFNRFGRPITQEQYFALPYGPVASNAMDLMEMDARALARAGVADLPFGLVKDGALVRLGPPKREIDREMFSRTDLQILEAVVAEYGDRTFKELFEATHDHPAWKLAWGRRAQNAKRSEMFYDEMIDSEEKRRAIVKDLSGVSMHL